MHRHPGIRFLRTLLITILTSTTLYSANKYAGEFIAIGVGGRALGLGGAYAALAADVTAGYWNPAGLSHLQYPQVSLMHDERFAGLVNYDYAAVALPAGLRTTVAISAVRLGVDNVANTRDAWTDLNHNGLPESNEIDYSRITYFNVADWALYFSYARASNDRFSYGANIKVIRRDNGDAAATGLGIDVGAQYRLTDRVILGGNLQDATTTLVAWNTGRNELISPTLKIGGAYLIDAFGGRFTPAFDIDLRFDNRRYASNAHLGTMSFDFHTGVEFSYKNLFALRSGYNELGSLTVGTGIRLPKLDIDYSFAKFDATDQLGNTHRISLTFTLEAAQFSRASE